jgi:hypothetical protein
MDRAFRSLQSHPPELPVIHHPFGDRLLGCNDSGCLAIAVIRTFQDILGNDWGEFISLPSSTLSRSLHVRERRKDG